MPFMLGMNTPTMNAATIETLRFIDLARKHLGLGAMVSSAQLCLDDAIALCDRGNNHLAARARALTSIAYSVGICHADYVALKAR